jgi:hypothetical protein
VFVGVAEDGRAQAPNRFLSLFATIRNLFERTDLIFVIFYFNAGKKAKNNQKLVILT